MYRQGDVLLVPVSEVDLSDAQEVAAQGERIVVVEGEATGHAHTLPATTTTAWLADDQMVLEVAAESALTHEEHDTIMIPAGVYRVVRQREYAPEAVQRSSRTGVTTLRAFGDEPVRYVLD